jgi:putative ABC transport system permease protein
LIINTQLFDDVVGQSNSGQLRNREYWIRTDAQTHDQLVSYPTIQNAVLGDSHKMFNIIRNHVMTLGTVRAFGLNGLILAIISLVGLLLANYFSFHQRKYEFGILRAYGLSLNQSNLLLVSEGILVLGLGLLSGVLLGYSLTELMRPYISSFVSRTLPGMVVHEIQFNWLTAAAIIGLLLVMYCGAMAVIIIALRRSNVQETLRTGDE